MLESFVLFSVFGVFNQLSSLAVLDSSPYSAHMFITPGLSWGNPDRLLTVRSLWGAGGLFWNDKNSALCVCVAAGKLHGVI